jgi:hypothetical protein
MGSVAVLGIVDMRGSLRPVPKRLRTLLLVIPLLSATVSSEKDLITAEPSNSHGGSSDRNIAWAERESDGAGQQEFCRRARANEAANAGKYMDEIEALRNELMIRHIAATDTTTDHTWTLPAQRTQLDDTESRGDNDGKRAV